MTLNTAWGDAIVEGSLEWSFLAKGDLPELAELCEVIGYFDNPTQRRTLPDLIIDFERPQTYASAHGVVGRDRGGTIVAYAWNHITPADEHLPHVWMEIGVHPAWRHHKIGLSLVAWSINRARAWYRHIKETRPHLGPLWVGQAVDEGSRLAEDLQADGRLGMQRWFFDAHRQLDQRLPEPELPEGYRLVPFTMEWSEAVRQAHNAAFSTRLGTHDVGREAWEASLARREFRTEWSWMVTVEGCETLVAGYALNSEMMDDASGMREGWTERFGVRPEYRSLGLGHALLIASMRSFAQVGCALAGLGVDTDVPDRASTLFTGLNYQLDDKMVLFGASFDS